MLSDKRIYVALIGAAVAIGMAGEALATIPYGSAGGPFPGFGPAVSPPPVVGGKEYSHDADSTTIGAIGSPPPFDAEQIIAWDGVGGTVDVTDYTGSRPLYTPDDEIDAIANVRDFAYNELKTDVAHLVFSVDDSYTLYSAGASFLGTVPAAGPVILGNGNAIGGAGEYSVEESTFFGNPADTQGLWASQAAVNGMPFPDDLDGVEVWGPEPPLADADKYSLDVDILSAGFVPTGPVSVWNGSGTPYVSHSLVVGAVTSLLGTPPTHIPVEELINLDALMVQDVVGDPDSFDRDPTGVGNGDEIIFSIRQIPDPLDPDGYYATGSELFVMSLGAPAVFLTHGGHVWDHAYALATFEVLGGTDIQAPEYGVIDINAIEAIGEFAVPEPTAIGILCIGCLVLGVGRFRRR